MKQRKILTAPLFVFSLLVLMVPLSGYTQQENREQIRRQVEILSGILREGLALENTRGFPVFNSGRVNGTYLQGQGVLLDINSPLASQRNQVSVSALLASIRELTGGSGSLSPVERPNLGELRETMALELEQSGDAYAQLREQIRAIDYERLVEASVREARSTITSLNDMGAVPPERVEEVRQELQGLRDRLQDSLAQLGQLDSERLAAGTGAGVEEFTERLQQIRQALDEARAGAAERLGALNQQFDQAEAEYQQRWLAQVGTFEDSLFSLLCDYGATLQSLPPDQKLTVRLVGLGAIIPQQAPADRMHVMSISDLVSCQSGAIDAVQLRERSVSYEY